MPEPASQDGKRILALWIARGRGKHGRPFPRKPCTDILRISVWCLAVCLGFPDPSSAAPPPPETLCTHWGLLFQQRLSPTQMPPALQRLLAYHQDRGFVTTFDEEKTVTLLKRPLRSSGELVFLPNQGLYRKLKTPFQQELLLTPAAMHQRDQRGNVETLSLDTLPVAKAFVDAFLSLFSGSWQTLQHHFQVYFRSENQRWQLGLKPKHRAMHSLIACIVLEGKDEHLATLRVQETNGDFTADRFSASRILTSAQWADYQPYFDWALKTRK